MCSRFLFISNIPFPVEYLQELIEKYPDNFGYLLHSEKAGDPHRIDLRNSNSIFSVISPDDKVIFFLEGNLALYVVKNFVKLDNSKNRTVFFVSSYLSKFLCERNSEKINLLQCERTLSEKYNRMVFVRIFLTPQEYERHFTYLDEKKSNDDMQFRQLVVPLQDVISFILEEPESEQKNIEKVFIKNLSKENLSGFISKVNYEIKNPLFIISQREKKEKTKALRYALYSIEKREIGNGTSLADLRFLPLPRRGGNEMIAK